MQKSKLDLLKGKIEIMEPVTALAHPWKFLPQEARLPSDHSKHCWQQTPLSLCQNSLGSTSKCPEIPVPLSAKPWPHLFDICAQACRHFPHVPSMSMLKSLVGYRGTLACGRASIDPARERGGPQETEVGIVSWLPASGMTHTCRRSTHRGLNQ